MDVVEVEGVEGELTETSKILWCGFNGFGNFDLDDKKRVKCSSKLRELNIFPNKIKNFSAVILSWKLTGFAFQNELYLHGFIDNKPNQTKKILTEDNILRVCNNDNILILLCNGKLFQLRSNNLNVLEEVKLRINLPRKRNSLGEVCTERLFVDKIACGFSTVDLSHEMLILVTKNKAVYNYPKKIYEFSNDIEIVKIVCGFLHCLLLTGAGDVYAFGDGLRGQLGSFELESTHIPKLVEALAGVKIVDVAAGGWHSIAISSIGDLYVWGNNSNGQLGISLYSSENISSKNLQNRKNPTIYPIPQLITFPTCCETENCDIIKVECGSRHTIALKQCGKLFSTGWNLYGQLGIKNKKSPNIINSQKKFYKDEFTEIKLTNCRIVNIYCNQWSSIIITNN